MEYKIQIFMCHLLFLLLSNKSTNSYKNAFDFLIKEGKIIILSLSPNMVYIDFEMPIHSAVI